MTWALILASKGGKRSGAAREVADGLLALGLRVGGFVERTEEPTPGMKVISLVHLRDGRVRELARTSTAAAPKADAASDASNCTLAFDPAGFAEARAWVEADVADADLFVLDGIGKLELAGEGNRAAVARALASEKLVVLALRDDQLVYAVEALGLEEPVAAYTDGEGAPARDTFVASLARVARG